jgi:hypothetical protein
VRPALPDTGMRTPFIVTEIRRPRLPRTHSGGRGTQRQSIFLPDLGGESPVSHPLCFCRMIWLFHATSPSSTLDRTRGCPGSGGRNPDSHSSP